jgi:hypothetical protein
VLEAELTDVATYLWVEEGRHGLGEDLALSSVGH